MRFNTRYLEVSLSGYMSFLLSRLDRPIIVSLFNAFMFFSSICASQLVWHEDSNANDSWHLIFPEAQWDKVVWQSLVWEKTTTTRRVKTFLTKIEVTQKVETSRWGWQKELIIFCVMMTTTKEMNDAWNQETKKHMTRNEKQKGNKEQSNRKTQAISSQPFLCSYHNNQWWTGMMPFSCDAGDVVVLLESCLGFMPPALDSFFISSLLLCCSWFVVSLQKNHVQRSRKDFLSLFFAFAERHHIKKKCESSGRTTKSQDSTNVFPFSV